MGHNVYLSCRTIEEGVSVTNTYTNLSNLISSVYTLHTTDQGKWLFSYFVIKITDYID